MFCGKCGNFMDDNAAFCPNCGAAAGNDFQAAEPVEEVQYYAETEVLSPEANNNQYYSQPQPVYPAFDLNTAGEVAKPKKKAKKAPFLIGGIAVVLIAALLVVFNWSNVSSFFERTFSAPDKLQTNVYEDVVSKTFDKVISSDEENSAPAVDPSNMGINGELRINIDEQILSMIPTEGIDVSFLSDIAVGYDLSVKNNLEKMVLDMILGDTSIISAETIVNLETLEFFASIPDLNDRAIYMNLKEIMEQNGMTSAIDPEMLEMLAEVIPSAETLEAIATRYVGLVMSGFGDVEKTTEKVAVSGISQNLHVLNATMDEKDLLALAEKLIETLQKDEDIESIILNLEEHMGQEGMYDSFAESMNQALESLAETDTDDMGDVKITLVTYLNDANDIVGITVKASMEDSKIEPFSWVTVEQGKKFATEVVVSTGSEEIVLEGSGENGETMNAEYVLSFDGNDIVIVELKDYVSNEEKLSGTVRISLPEAILEDLIANANLNDSIAELIGSAEPALEIKVDNNNQGGNVSVALTVGSKNLLSISASAQYTSPDSIELPEDYVEMQDEDSAMAWMETMNPDFLDTLMDRLIEAGVPAELFAFT